MNKTALFLISLFLFFRFSSILGQDTLKYVSLNGRYDCTIINLALPKTYTDIFLQQLSDSKQASIYHLYDSAIVLDQKDTIKLPTQPLNIGIPYVSAHTCFHQRNYALNFVKLSLDSYTCTLDILTDHKIRSQMQFTITLQPSILIRNDNIIYKDRNSNLKVVVQGSNTIVLENLFIDNQPCPRTIMFTK